MKHWHITNLNKLSQIAITIKAAETKQPIHRL